MKLYIETPVSVKPEKSCSIFVINKDGTKDQFPYDASAPNFNGNEECWLRPVSAQEVPSDIDIVNRAERRFPKWYDNIEQEQKLNEFVQAQKEMRDNLLPTIVLLKEENERLKEEKEKQIIANDELDKANRTLCAWARKTYNDDFLKFCLENPEIETNL